MARLCRHGSGCENPIFREGLCYPHLYAKNGGFSLEGPGVVHYDDDLIIESPEDQPLEYERNEQAEALAAVIRRSWGQHLENGDDALRFTVKVEGLGAWPISPMQVAEALCITLNGALEAFDLHAGLVNFRGVTLSVDQTSLAALHIYENGWALKESELSEIERDANAGN